MICPQCGRRYGDDKTLCPDDGAELLAIGTAASRRPTPRTLPSGPSRAAALGSSLIGATVAERFVIEARIGSGGMGVVYRARQLLVDRPIALKILSLELASDPASARRFTNEAKAISQLRHPHVVTLYDFGLTEEGRPFIAMELVRGEPVSVLIKRGAIPLTEAVHIVRQTADALQAAHDMGIVHRDIKADNVMIESRSIGRDQVRVLDFGIARSSESDSRLTQTGVVFGTPQYCSPEQAMGQPLDHRSDLYSLGVLFFEMLTGRLPFTDKVGPMLPHRHINEPAPRLSEAAPDRSFPTGLEAMVASRLAKGRERRPATARRLSEGLAALDLTDMGPTVVEPMGSSIEVNQPLEPLPGPDSSLQELMGARDSTPLPASPSRLALWLALGIGTAAAAGAVWLILDQADAPSPPRPASQRVARTPAAPERASPASGPHASALPAQGLSDSEAMDPMASGLQSSIDPRLLAGARDYLSAPPVPAWLLAENADEPVPPPISLAGLGDPPAGQPAGVPGDAAGLRKRASELRRRAAGLPSGSPEHAQALMEAIAVQWATANADLAQARALYDAQANTYLAGKSATEPVVPEPVYGPVSPDLEAWLAAHGEHPLARRMRYLAGLAALSAGRRDEAWPTCNASRRRPRRAPKPRRPASPSPTFSSTPGGPPRRCPCSRPWRPRRTRRASCTRSSCSPTSGTT